MPVYVYPDFDRKLVLFQFSGNWTWEDFKAGRDTQLVPMIRQIEATGLHFPGVVDMRYSKSMPPMSPKHLLEVMLEGINIPEIHRHWYVLLRSEPTTMIMRAVVLASHLPHTMQFHFVESIDEIITLRNRTPTHSYPR